MWYWILAFILTVSPGLIAQESPDSLAPPADQAATDSANESNPAVVPGVAPDGSDQSAVAEAVPPTLFPPQNIVAEDIPDDDGQAILVTWTSPAEGKPIRYILEIAGSDGFFQELTQTMLMEYTVSQLENNQPYRFRITAVYENGKATSDETGPVEPKDHWLKLGELPVIFAILIFMSLLLYFIQAARRGVESIHQKDLRPYSR